MISNRLKDVRKAKGLTQQEIADRVGLSKNFISLLENGSREPSDRTLRDYAEALGVSYEYLKNGTGEMFQPQTRDEELASFMAEVLQDPNESGRKRLVAALAKLPPERWEQMADLIEAIAAGMK